MSWGNADNSWNDQSMDSNGQKLVVRNSGASVGTDFQAEIADASVAAKALRINGKIEFKRDNHYC